MECRWKEPWENVGEIAGNGGASGKFLTINWEILTESLESGEFMICGWDSGKIKGVYEWIILEKC